MFSPGVVLDKFVLFLVLMHSAVDLCVTWTRFSLFLNSALRVAWSYLFIFYFYCRLRLREMMRRSLRAASMSRHESGPSSGEHQDPVSPPIAPPSWVPDPPPMDPGRWCLCVHTISLFCP